MSLCPNLANRSEAIELMDDFSIGGAELVETLAQLRHINRLLDAARPTVEGVAYLWRQSGRPGRLSLLDVGAGSGDSSRPLLTWAIRRGVDLRLFLLDRHPQTCAVAQTYHRREPRVQVVQGDVWRPGLAQVDIVTASLFLHHFPTGQLLPALRSMLQAARLGVVINDLHRHCLAWLFIKAAVHLFSSNRLIRHDAPLSVRRGFRAAELRKLQDALDLDRLRIVWRPFFRYLVVISH